MKPNKFIKTEDYYNDEFFRICRFIISAYNKLVADKIKHNSNYETFLRNVFVKKYLREFKHEYGLGYLGFEIEPGVINDQYKTISFLDIKIYNIGNPNYLNEEEYYAIECKRLDGTTAKNSEYVDEGILRFVILKYSADMPLAAMIGFVENKNISEVVLGINIRLKNHKTITTNKMLATYNLTSGFERFYSSSHARKKKFFKLYHFMFDYSNLITQRKKKTAI